MMLKDKYNPRSSFFQAELGDKPSYLWRSLLERKKVLMIESRWRISNGQKIDV
ncbi:hypothetical protein REPUB_Repub04eG0220100 [Reevesia pubescens]